MTVFLCSPSIWGPVRNIDLPHMNFISELLPIPTYLESKVSSFHYDKCIWYYMWISRVIDVLGRLMWNQKLLPTSVLWEWDTHLSLAAFQRMRRKRHYLVKRNILARVSRVIDMLGRNLQIDNYFQYMWKRDQNVFLQRVIEDILVERTGLDRGLRTVSLPVLFAVNQ